MSVRRRINVVVLVAAFLTGAIFITACGGSRDSVILTTSPTPTTSSPATDVPPGTMLVATIKNGFTLDPYLTPNSSGGIGTLVPDGRQGAQDVSRTGTLVVKIELVTTESVDLFLGLYVRKDGKLTQMLSSISVTVTGGTATVEIPYVPVIEAGADAQASISNRSTLTVAGRTVSFYYKATS